MLQRSVVLTLLALLAACSSTPPGAPCETSDDCAAGESCILAGDTDTCTKLDEGQV